MVFIYLFTVSVLGVVGTIMLYHGVLCMSFIADRDYKFDKHDRLKEDGSTINAESCKDSWVSALGAITAWVTPQSLKAH